MALFLISLEPKPAKPSRVAEILTQIEHEISEPVRNSQVSDPGRFR